MRWLATFTTTLATVFLSASLQAQPVRTKVAPTRAGVPARGGAGPRKGAQPTVRAPSFVEALSGQVDAWKEQRKLEGLFATGNGANALNGLPRKLARAALKFDPLPGTLSGDDPDITMRPELSYVGAAAESATKELLANIGSIRGPGDTLCIAGPDRLLGSMPLALGAKMRLLEALGAPEGSTEPVPQLLVKTDGSSASLGEEDLGKPLFDALVTDLKAGLDVPLQIWPPPRVVPVKLALHTENGETISLPVELNGAARTIELAPGTQWLVGRARRPVPLDRERVGQEILLGRTARVGTLRLAPSDLQMFRPVWTTRLERVYAFALHYHGDGAQWFGSTDFDLSATMSVEQQRESCAVYVEFRPDKVAIQLGPQPIETWRKVTGLRLLDRELEEADVGYLDPPSCSTAGRWAASDHPGAEPRALVPLEAAAQLGARSISVETRLRP